MTARDDDGFAQVVLRVPATLLARIDAHTERVRRRVPGVEISRAGTIRSLLLAALASVETEEAADIHLRGAKSPPTT